MKKGSEVLPCSTDGTAMLKGCELTGVSGEFTMNLILHINWRIVPDSTPWDFGIEA